MTAIHLENLVKRFGTSEAPVVAADHIDFTFPADEITAVIGESGCGKTTLLRLVAGLETPDEGVIRFDGTPGAAAPEIGVVFQEPRLFPWLSVEENLRLAVRHLSAAEQARRLEHVLALTGLAGARHRMPGALSGGMAQRAGFARALAPSPEILLLDEAFSALDALTRTRVRREFLNIHAAHPMTTILVTHDILEACLTARTIVRLKNGRVHRTYHVDAPYPRTLANPELTALSEAIWNDFFTDGAVS